MNTLFNIQEKASSQNLKHCCCQQNEQNEEPSPQSQQSQQTRFRPSHNRNNQQHHAQNRTDQSQFPDQNYQKYHQPQPQHQTQSQQTSLYIGNLDQKVNEEDLYEHFDIKSTKYLSENSYINFVMDEQTGKSKGYAFVTVPTHINEELMKLNGLEFTGKNLVIEEAQKKTSERCKFASKTRPESVEQPKTGPSNTELIPPKRQSPFQKINNSYPDTVSPKMKSVVIFLDSMVKGLKMEQFNSQIHGGKVYLKGFPGAKADELNHNVEPNLEEYEYDAAIILVGINDILRSKGKKTRQMTSQGRI